MWILSDQLREINHVKIRCRLEHFELKLFMFYKLKAPFYRRKYNIVFTRKMVDVKLNVKPFVFR